MVVMIYNWEKLEWSSEYTEYASYGEATDTIEMNCAKVVYNDQIKIYVMMQKAFDISR